jgi:hypothetical protein
MNARYRPPRRRRTRLSRGLLALGILTMTLGLGLVVWAFVDRFNGADPLTARAEGKGGLAVVALGLGAVVHSLPDRSNTRPWRPGRPKRRG